MYVEKNCAMFFDWALPKISSMNRDKGIDGGHGALGIVIEPIVGTLQMACVGLKKGRSVVDVTEEVKLEPFRDDYSGHVSPHFSANF